MIACKTLDVDPVAFFRAREKRSAMLSVERLAAETLAQTGFLEKANPHYLDEVLDVTDISGGIYAADRATDITSLGHTSHLCRRQPVNECTHSRLR